MSESKKVKGLDRFTTLATIIISLVSIILAWQANRVAREANTLASQQVNAQVVILDAKNIWDGKSTGSPQSGNAKCHQQIRLANLNGGATSLVGYEATLSYKNLVTHAQGSVASASPFIPRDISPILTNFIISFYSTGSEPEYLTFPVKLDAYSTIDIGAVIEFTYDGTVIKLESPLHNDLSSFYYSPSMISGFTPMEVMYTLTLTNGQVIKSPIAPCWYIQ